MADNKKYYWLKLKKDFFADMRLRKLRRLGGGDTYAIYIYARMMLLAVDREGIIPYTGLEETFPEELALNLDEDEAAVLAAYKAILKCGLIEEREEGGCFIPGVVDNTGSETKEAEKKRRQRQQGDNVPAPAENVPGISENVPLEIETELKKETELKAEVQVQEEKEIHTGADVHTEGERKEDAGDEPTPTGVKNGPKKPFGTYNWVMLSDEEYGALVHDLGFKECMRCVKYIDEMAQSTNNKNKWSDWNLIVRRCSREGWGLGRGNRRESTVTFADLKKQMEQEGAFDVVV